MCSSRVIAAVEVRDPRALLRDWSCLRRWSCLGSRRGTRRHAVFWAGLVCERVSWLWSSLCGRVHAVRRPCRGSLTDPLLLVVPLAHPDSPRRPPLLVLLPSRTKHNLTGRTASHAHPTTPLPHSASPASLHPTLLDSLAFQTPSPRPVHGCVRSLLRTQGWISPSRLVSTRKGPCGGQAATGGITRRSIHSLARTQGCARSLGGKTG